MAEINIPKFKYRPPTQEMLFQKIAEKNYKPIVEIISDEFRSQVEGDVLKVIQSYGINVDKDELIKALKYDRQQYEKGFADGCRNSIADLKAEVAREIIDDILEALQGESDLENTRGREDWEKGDTEGYHIHQYAEDKLDALVIALSLYKKKYTEDQT